MQCTIDIDDAGEYTNFHTSKVVTAKKPHTCSECKGVIKTGSKYERVFLVCDGMPQTYKTCHICHEIRNHIFCSWYYTEIWMHIGYELDEDENKIFCAMEELSDDARQEMIDFIDNHWGF